VKGKAPALKARPAAMALARERAGPPFGISDRGLFCLSATYRHHHHYPETRPIHLDRTETRRSPGYRNAPSPLIVRPHCHQTTVHPRCYRRIVHPRRR
jgi:hypothetical protein